MKKIKLISILIILFYAQDSYALGLSVSPSNLKIESKVEEKVSKILTVENASADVSIFEVYADNFDDIITIWPTSFILESGDRRQVEVIVYSDDSKSISTNISVISKPVTDGAFNANTGIKIPIELTVEGDISFVQASIIGALGNFNTTIVVIAIIVGVFGFVLGRVKIKKWDTKL